MKALLIGAGGVGSAIANIASRRPFITSMVVADRSLPRAQASVLKVNDSRFSAEEVDASDVNDIRALIRKVAPDIVINAVDPRFVMPIFLACEEEKVNYMDMAMSLSKAHPEDPLNKPGIKLGDEQFARTDIWSKNGNYALVGMGIEPGMSDVFARYAA
ncbi:MAG: saccharopine dehydrogenase NADP-binding domain-containing protein, partial [Actinomycetales bacterium]|nr:saccharopine dehydrogenase NADP-binding domain-containing protein [Actinomycetales bacterium]